MRSMRPSLILPFRLVRAVASLTQRSVETIGIENARAALRESTSHLSWFFGTRTHVETVADETIAGVRIRRYLPSSAATGTIVYFHGGGWTVGDLDTHDKPCRALASAAGCTLVAVDYRLAPEHPFPAAIDDCAAVTEALLDRGPVVVAGDSAGGHLAAVMARRFSQPPRPLVGQVLIYPVTDCVTEAPSYETFANDVLLSRKTMRFYRNAFLPTKELEAHPDASPLRAPSLPTAPAYVLLAQCDVLHDEGAAYAEKLRRDGTAVICDDVAGVPHGFLHFQGLSAPRAAMARVAAFIRSTMASSPSLTRR
jgi:acetyl esterase